MIDVYTFEGDQDGPHLLLLGGIHGNEVVGPNVLRPFVKALESGQQSIQRGRLTIVPICNPKAYEAGTRQTEKNLNRCIRDFTPDESSVYEDLLALEIMPLIRDCDYMLDLHSTHMQGDPEFVFMNEHNKDSMSFARALGVRTLLVGWENVNEAEDFTTEAYANNVGAIGVTLECGYHNDPMANKVAETAIDGALKYLGSKSGEADHPADNHSTIYRFEKLVRYNEGDKFTKPWKHLEPVEKGAPIYTTAQGDVVRADKDGVILIPNPEPMVGTEYYYFGTKGF